MTKKRDREVHYEKFLLLYVKTNITWRQSYKLNIHIIKATIKIAKPKLTATKQKKKKKNNIKWNCKKEETKQKTLILEEK